MKQFKEKFQESLDDGSFIKDIIKAAEEDVLLKDGDSVEVESTVTIE
jgi:hypothetical protein